MDYYDETADLFDDCPLVNRSLLYNLKLDSWLLSERLFLNWTPLHHIYFQLSEFFLLLCWLTTTNNLMRLFSMISSLFAVLFSVFVLKSYDLVAWNLLFVLINLLALFYQACCFFCSRYCCWRKFGNKDFELVYKKLFQPLHVTRRQFAKILSCKRNTRQLHPGETYASEKQTRVDSLALLLSGKLLVSQSSRPLHMIIPHQFVDSPEYFGVSTDELFQVSITAVEESKLLVWHRDKLRLTILADEFLREIFDHIIGRDVVRKLIQVSDSVSVNAQQFYTKSTIPESEPMLNTTDIMNNFETTEIWSLTKIAEEETPV